MPGKLSEAALEARRKYQQAWRQANRDKRLEYERSWRAANGDKVRARQQRYWERKAERMKQNAENEAGRSNQTEQHSAD